MSQTIKLKRVVIKIGSNVITRDNGHLNLLNLHKIVNVLSQLKSKGIEILLVSSGAVSAGRSVLKEKQEQIANKIIRRQILASVGQAKLIDIYSRFFDDEGLISSQILATKEDFRDRQHYQNLQNCLQALLQTGIVPIANENDTVSINTVTFSDNDELAGLLAGMINAEAVIILTSVDGLFDGDPAYSESKLIKEITSKDRNWTDYISDSISSFGRGGMLAKCKVAIKNANLGITTYLINGHEPNLLLEVIAGSNPGTKFVANKKVTGPKKRIAYHSGFEKGLLIIDAGAEKALRDSKARSLLPVGIVAIDGQFQKGDLVKIENQKHQLVGYGVSQVSSETAQEMLNSKKAKPIIRYDYLFLE